MPGTSAPHEALDLLIEDHRRVRQLFWQFAREDDASIREDIVRTACSDLRIHATIEEELFYPTIQGRIKDPDLVDEATVEHDVAKALMDRLAGMTPDDAMFDATFKVLGETVERHIAEEEGVLFAEVRRARVDFVTMAAAMTERRLQLREQLDAAAAT